MPWSAYTPPPNPVVDPPVMERFEIIAVTPESTWKTRLALFPLTVTGPSLAHRRIVTDFFSSSWPCVSPIVAELVPSSNSMLEPLFALT